MTRRELMAGIAAASATFSLRRGDAMQAPDKIRVLFIAGFGPIVRKVAASQKLCAKGLQIAFKEENGGSRHTDALQGARHFAPRPLSQAAESCFGNSTWPDSLPAPHAWLEFDVARLARAKRAVESPGHPMLYTTQR